MTQDQQPRRETGDSSTQDDATMPSINADRTAPYAEPVVNQVVRETYGASADEIARGDATISPTFSDTEPGAGTNYGAAGDPDAPNLGGIEDQTTLGPEPVRPPDRRLVREGEFEGDGGQPSGGSSYGRSPKNGLGGASTDEPQQPGRQAPAGPQQPQHPTSGDERESAPGGESPYIPTSPRTNAAPGHGNNLGGEGAYAPRPLPGEATQGVASMTNPTTDRITEKNKPGVLPGGQFTYGAPQVFEGDGEVGRFGSTSGGAGELPGGHLKELAHGGQPVEHELPPEAGGADSLPRRTPPDQSTLTP